MLQECCTLQGGAAVAWVVMACIWVSAQAQGVLLLSALRAGAD